MEPQNNIEPAVPLLAPALKGPMALLREAWNVYKQSWKPLIAIMLIPPVVAGVGVGLMALDNTGTNILGFVVALAGAVLFIAMQGAIIDAVRKADAAPAERISIKGQYRFGLSLFWAFILLAIIQAFINAGSFVIFIIPGIIMVVYTCFYLFAFVLEGKKGLSAMTESFLAVRGRWWKVLGCIVMLIVVYLIFNLIARGLGFLIAHLAGFAPRSDEYMTTLGILSQIMGIIVGPFAVVYMYKLYQSLKESRLTDADGAAFRKWLIAFIVIGVATVIAMLALSIYSASTIIVN